MTLPTFVGIGVQRAGTTWLHNVLASHPDIYMPTIRKEIRFFDRDYERGLDYYESFFCTQRQATAYQAIGEISPQYYEDVQCPQRIYKCLADPKLVIMLRHPVDRAYSHYGFVVQKRNYRGTFSDFVEDRPKALEKGFYSRYVKLFLNYFARTQFLVMLFEEVFKDKSHAQQTLAEFLNVSAQRFSESVGKTKMNASSVPTHGFVFGSIVKTGRVLRRYKLDPLFDFVKRIGVEQTLANGRPLPPLDSHIRYQLSQRFLEDIDELEQCLQTDLSCWRD